MLSTAYMIQFPLPIIVPQLVGSREAEGEQHGLQSAILPPCRRALAAKSCLWLYEILEPLDYRSQVYYFPLL